MLTRVLKAGGRDPDALKRAFRDEYELLAERMREIPDRFDGLARAAAAKEIEDTLAVFERAFDGLAADVAAMVTH